MMRASRGDGHTPTRLLDPCRCPICRTELIITCSNNCASAADGVDGHVDPGAAMIHAPRAPESPRISKRGPEGCGTAGRIIACLRMADAPMSAPQLATELGAPAGRVSMMLSFLVRRGDIRRVARGQYAVVAA